jgi:VanZ family protein
VNGNLAQTSPRFGLSTAGLTGQPIVGNNPIVDNGWQGQLRGWAIYNRELTPAEVTQHFVIWTTLSAKTVRSDNPAALYSFGESAVAIVHNQMDSGNDFQIPQRYRVVHQQVLELPWDEFDPSWSYCKNVLINMGGFIPLGFCFCAYFTMARSFERLFQASIILGAAVSCLIEVLQSFLPTRDSGVTDIITNTLGSVIGAVFYEREWIQDLLASIGLSRVCCIGIASKSFRRVYQVRIKLTLPDNSAVGLAQKLPFGTAFW